MLPPSLPHNYSTWNSRFKIRCLAVRATAQVLVLLTFAATLLFAGVPSQAESFTEDSGFWTTTSTSFEPAEKWRAGIAVQTRSREDFAELERTVIRPSLSYNVFGKTWVTAGYDAHFIELPNDRLEQRAWQQWLTIWPAKLASFSARVRFEERFIEDVDGAAVRLRLQARADFPIEGTDWKFTASNEFFVGLNDLEQGPNDGFDQNRAYLGVGHPLTNTLALKLGYQMQYINRENTEDLMVHQLMIGLSLR